MKIIGMILIILFSFSLSLIITEHKKYQILYIDKLIYMSEYILLLLNSTAPETDEIIHLLKTDKNLAGVDFNDEKLSSPLSNEENERVKRLFNVLGKYDTESQIKYINEFKGYFKLLKEQYQEHFNTHRKLYLTLGLFSGVLVSVLLI